MKCSLGTRGWRSMLGVIAASIFACSVQVQGAPPGQGSGEVRGKPPLKRTLRVAPPVNAYSVKTVIQREGVGTIPLLLDLEGSGYGATLKTGGTCRANIDCDDCDPCTTDICTVTPPAIVGKCSNDPTGICSTCSDDVFCNGPELCDAAGICRAATPGLPCSSDPGTTCDPIGGPQGRGSCETPCSGDGDCDDGLECTGTETCVNPGPNGLCRSVNAPCGPAVACQEQICIGGTNDGLHCTSNAQCPGVGGSCQVGAQCIARGRCCKDDGNGDFLACSRANKSDCINSGGRWLFVGDDPGTPGDQANCTNPAPPTASNAGETFNCPQYAAGIDSEVDLDTLVAVGKIGAASCNSFTEVGDDFELAIPDGKYLEVTTVRLARQFQQDGIPGSASRVRITFYDSEGNFIEDVITDPEAEGSPAVRTYIFAEKPVVPKNGYIAVRAAPRFSPFGKSTLFGGLASDDTGVNDDTIMWLNGAPAAAADVWNLLGVNPSTPGRLAFEIVGNVVDDPRGACCDADAGTCALALPWKCEKSRCSLDPDVLCDNDTDCSSVSAGTCLIPGYFQGSETQCQACSNSTLRSCTTAADCPSCTINVDDPGTCQEDPPSSNTPCQTNADCVGIGTETCIPAPCDPDADCPGGVCTGGSCVGGSNDGNACDVDTNCVSGTCTATAPCDPVPPACTLQACCPDTPDGTCMQIGAGESCPAGYTSRGNGTNCDPNLCEQPLDGFDTCAAAALPGNVHVFDVTKLSGCQTETWTITGDNSTATFNDNPGTCEFAIFDQGGGTQDRGWWHAFSINACANVRMDFCGTTELFGETKQPGWANLYNSCDPCTTTIASTVVGDQTAGAGCVGTDDSSNDRGLPFCAEDDLWETYGPLPAGTYWYPVYSAPSGTFGKYQLHFTVSACPRAACCLPDGMCVKVDNSLVFDGGGATVSCADDSGCAALTYCDNDVDKVCSTSADCKACVGGTTPDAACTVDGDCGGGGTCTGTSTCRAATCELCAEVNSFDCATAGGKWNGFGSERVQCPGGTCVNGTCQGGTDDGFGCSNALGEPVASCDIPTDDAACDLGSCCAGPALCNDRDQPGIPCNPDNPSTCITRADCVTSGGSFVGGAGCDDTIPPCPACGNVGENNCNFPLGQAFTYMSDLSSPNGTVVADDFEPQSSTLESVCVWGTYMDPTGPGQSGPAGYEQYSCVGTPVGERFRVRVFGDTADDGDPLTPGGIPDTTNLIGESTVTGSNIVSGTFKNTTFEATFGIVMQEYTLTLDTPITGMSPGTTYWLEVADYTPDPDGNQCYWNWAMFIDPVKDGQAASGISQNPLGHDASLILERPSTYVEGSEKGGVDMAFCLTTTGGAPLDFNKPDAPQGCCYDCDTLAGTEGKTLVACIRDQGIWKLEDPPCGGAPEQLNDQCTAAAAAAKSIASSLTCGDGVIDVGEQCDDGNTMNDDGCDDQCQLECAGTVTAGPGAEKITDGLYKFDNICADVDGPTQIRGEGGDFNVDGDIWFEYTATCTGVMTVDMCATQSGWNVDGYTGNDSAHALYGEIGITRCEDGTNADQECVCPGSPPSAKCHDFTQCPGGTGVCRSMCPCPGPIQGISPLQVGDGTDETCDGIADAGAGVIQRQVFPNECYLIRAGSWMAAGGVPGSGNRGRGLMSVGCQAAACFPSDPPAVQQFADAGGAQVNYRKARFISIETGSSATAGRQQAIRVTWKSMPTTSGWDVWNGQSLFAGEPHCASESSASLWSTDVGGDGCDVGGGTELWVATLQCVPYFTDWSQYPVVHLMHEAIVPSELLNPGGPLKTPALYDVQFVDSSCVLSLEASYSAATEVRTAAWCDNQELASGSTRTPGDNVSVFDTLGYLAKFSNSGGPTKPAVDMVGVTASGEVVELDGKMTVSDLIRTLDAFGSTLYPYTPGDVAPPPGACPP